MATIAIRNGNERAAKPSVVDQRVVQRRRQQKSDTLGVTDQKSSLTGLRFLQSYGAFCEIFKHLSPMEILKLQALNRWMYEKGVGRIQTKWQRYQNYFYFVHPDP